MRKYTTVFIIAAVAIILALFQMDFLVNLFNTSDYPARWNCGNWGSFEGWIHILSDSAIWLAYFLIPITLFFFGKYHNKSLPKPIPTVLPLFIAFIFCCGTGHLIDAMMFYYPAYRFLGLVKMITAIVSWATVAAMLPVIPKVFRLRTQDEFDAVIEDNETRLREINQELERFAYVTSHDLKAPLRGISTLSDWIKEELEGVEKPDEVDEYLDLMKGRVHRMEELIKGILEYSRVGRNNTEKEDIDTNIVVDDIIGMFADQKIARSHLPLVHVNKAAAMQVFSNLISNAIKYNDKEVAEVHVDAVVQNDFAQFCISDNGPGIDPQYHEKVFQAFQTLHARDDVEATGLGLAITQKIIKSNGGEIWIDSEGVGDGSRFYFTLPLGESNE